MRRIPGGLLHVNILACGIFGSVSGSSAATCATVSKIALPELKRRGYDEDIAIGSLATSGTLGILIPPSIIMVVYAVAAEVSIIRVFIAGCIPGLLVMLLFSGYIVVWALLNPDKQPPRDARMSFAAKLRQSAQLIPCHPHHRAHRAAGHRHEAVRRLGDGDARPRAFGVLALGRLGSADPAPGRPSLLRLRHRLASDPTGRTSSTA